MKCTSCGLPLSPSHTPTNCPRCGTAYSGSLNYGAATTINSAYWETQVLSMQEEHLLQITSGRKMCRVLLLIHLHHNLGKCGHGKSTNLDISSPPPHPPTGSRNTKLGFILAGLCILAGALILIFVYFSASGLPGSNSSNSATITSTSTPNVSTSTPTTAPTATAIPSQTATTYPGQQYVDNAQMSAAVDPNTLQPSQLTTTFKTGQNIYVSFQVHPNGHAGAVCIIWYLNSKQITNFSLPVSATSKYSYAYSIYGGAGPAYVELYWASSTQCTDQVLAQHVDFTVTN